MSTIAFRATAEDRALVRELMREGETTTDVLRRALRALHQERWDAQMQADADRIEASGEDLGAEPDAW
ncbi:hypothetical protein [Nocardia sp. NPDC019395]|uniref:hypothetical protein n=1 Tax=Nocardia sp. NPDC019395 TaxID=3154686 RepID=UPI0033E1087E